MITDVLRYKKSETTKAGVMRQKAGFRFSKAWIFRETPTEYTLSLDDNLVQKYYETKIKLPYFG